MIRLKDPWVEATNPSALIAELEREIGSNHYLTKFKSQFRVVARNESNDDVLYAIREFGYILVHLTWSKNEPSKRHPIYQMLPKESNLQNIIDYSS